MPFMKEDTAGSLTMASVDDNNNNNNNVLIYSSASCSLRALAWVESLRHYVLWMYPGPQMQGWPYVREVIGWGWCVLLPPPYALV